MALKRLKTKKSKRISGRLKYKIQKKVRDHNKKERRQSKKNPNKKSKKQKLIQIPNLCPFKEEILKDVESTKLLMKKKLAQQQEDANVKRTNPKLESLEKVFEDAEMRSYNFEEDHNKEATSDTPYKFQENKELSLKQYCKEFKKVVNNADVVIEVVDSRDPLGTRCADVEQAVRNAPGNKKLVLVLNKADLVPKENLKSWLKYFRRICPVCPFKASTQEQANRLGHRKLHQMNTEKSMQGSLCFGRELLMSMLANYCRNKGIRTSIRVGVVGIPNVGKSSIINSLTRGKSCMVGSTPGVTKSMQEVELDSKIKLIDCPGIVFANSEQDTIKMPVLKNVQRVGNLSDPFTAAEDVLKRASKDYFSKMYNISTYNSFEEFFAKKATRMGKFLRGGIPDVASAARSVLNDWNNGKIKYCTEPPKIDDETHISASIVTQEFREFDVDNFEMMETAILDSCNVAHEDAIKLESTNRVSHIKESEIIEENTQSSEGKKNEKTIAGRNKNKIDPTLLLEGNQKLNKGIKRLQKNEQEETLAE